MNCIYKKPLTQDTRTQGLAQCKIPSRQKLEMCLCSSLFSLATQIPSGLSSHLCFILKHKVQSVSDHWNASKYQFNPSLKYAIFFSFLWNLQNNARNLLSLCILNKGMEHWLISASHLLGPLFALLTSYFHALSEKLLLRLFCSSLKKSAAKSRSVFQGAVREIWPQKIKFVLPKPGFLWPCTSGVLLC